jgi:hypothetical protein
MEASEGRDSLSSILESDGVAESDGNGGLTVLAGRTVADNGLAPAARSALAGRIGTFLSGSCVLAGV